MTNNERDGYPAGVPCWVDSDRPEPEASLSFYEGLFGWRFEDQMPAEASGRYFVAKLGGRSVAAIGSRPEGAPDTPPAWNTYVAVESADEVAAKVREAGGAVSMEPFDALGAGRMAVCADAEGAGFCLWQAGETKGAQLVNSPGSWNFSDLNSGDLERAKAFYGSVFGWKLEMVSVDGFEFGFWALPGYGDFLEQRDPELRERMAADNAPEGFADAVASMVPSEDATPHWGITFAVDDTDATASRAAELGGTVEVPPFDAGPVRNAVLRDPDGARLTVGKYDPER
jgi:uncharacterized protein